MTPITTPRRRRAAAVAQLDLIDLIAEMERQDAARPAAPAVVEKPSIEDSEPQRQARAATARRNGRPPVRFRHPTTGETWTGRGLRPRWVMEALEGGMTMDQLEIER